MVRRFLYWSYHAIVTLYSFTIELPLQTFQHYIYTLTHTKWWSIFNPIPRVTCYYMLPSKQFELITYNKKYFRTYLRWCGAHYIYDEVLCTACAKAGLPFVTHHTTAPTFSFTYCKHCCIIVIFLSVSCGRPIKGL